MKPNRRVFLKSAIAACSAGAFLRPVSAKGPVIPFYKAVFDERFEEARVFAADADARNIPTAAIHGDITRLFFDDLDLRWKQGPVWLTGLTTPDSLFCLDLLARDRGMRLRHCVTKPSGPSDLVFWIIAPNSRAATKETAHA